MAATVVLIEDEVNWDIIREVLYYLEQGGIVMGPKAIEKFKERYQLDPTDLDDKYLEYDFGGEPDIVVDHVIQPDHMAAKAIASAMGWIDTGH